MSFSILRALVLTVVPLALYGIVKLVRAWTFPRSSPLRILQGPKAKSILFGNLGEIRKVENQVLHEEWTRKYGKVLVYKGFLNVCCYVVWSPPTALTCIGNKQMDRLYTMDMRAINHVLTHSMDYQKPAEARDGLTRLLGAGMR